MEIEVRPEQAGDLEAIRRVNAAAFGREAEGALVDALREAGALVLSLVAIVEARVVGHIAFSPGRVAGQDVELDAVALGPMAVLPEFQGRGVGSRLVTAGLQDLRGGAAGPVFVLGHPWFYPRFGFQPAHRFGVQCEFAVSPEVFMVWAPGGAAPAGLGTRDPGAQGGATFYYRPEFRGV